MKRGILFITIISVFLFPSNLLAKKFFVKMAFGVASGGNIDDTLFTQTEYSQYLSIGQEKQSKLGQGVYLEFIYQVNPHLSFSIGNGYAYKILKGKTAEFKPPKSINFDASYFLISEFSTEAIPIYFSAIFSLPFTSSFQINLTGGVGYYFGTFESKSKWRTSLPSFSTWEYRSWNFKGDVNTVGFHLGAGFDVDLTWNLFLTVDVLYRMINFNEIKSSGEIGEETTFSFLQFYEGKELLADSDYRVTRASLSGLSFRIGLKFKF